MIKSELIDSIADKHDLSRRQAEGVVNDIFDLMKDALINGERIEFRGFGSFNLNDYQGYVGRNPKTGEQTQIGPKRRVRFRYSEQLFQRLNEGLDA